MSENNETFSYSYSAAEQEEIKAIRSKYAPPTKEEATMEQLRRLDESAGTQATIVSIVLGVVSTLILGVGMCCTMLPGWEKFFVLGIIVGVIGIAGIAASYPVYTRLLKRKREELAPEIMRLTEELMK